MPIRKADSSLFPVLLIVAGLHVSQASEFPAAADQAASSVPKDPSTPKIPIDPAGDPFFAPMAAKTGPQTMHEKFIDYTVAAYGPRAMLASAFPAAFSMLNPPSGYPREWRQGVGAYGRIYGTKLATRTTEHTARFLASAILHEDFRYRPSSSKNGLGRFAHAIAFVFVDKSDSGGNRLALANFAGAAAGGFVQQLYLPSGYDTLGRTGRHIGFTLISYAGQNLGREFAPEISKVARKLHVPFPRVPFPEWWVKRN